jgi:hypothetical protein
MAELGAIPWDQLLVLIDGGHVVPVLGEDLPSCDKSGVATNFCGLLAEAVAGELKVEFRPGDTLASVASRLVRTARDAQTIYPTIKSLLDRPPLRDLRPSSSLMKLAEIRPFKMFVTTSCDDMLSTALNEVRYQRKALTKILDYSVERPQDLEAGIDALERATVFHLFGRASAVPEYAVTEEDYLEFIHAIQSETRRPNRLFQELGRKRLLMIGTSLSDWLTRFFLRASKPEPLSLRKTGDYFVNVTGNPDLVLFLQNFYGKTLIFSTSPAEFIDELHRRWRERHAASAAEVDAPEPPTLPQDMQPGSVFISYASEDREVAQSICAALEHAGVDAWFDRDEISGGEAFENKILNAIERSSLFVPIISRHVLAAGRRFFRREWRAAEEALQMAGPNDSYLIPVLTDETRIENDQIPRAFRKVHYYDLPGGRVTPDFLKGVVQAYRAYQKEKGPS